MGGALSLKQAPPTARCVGAELGVGVGEAAWPSLGAQGTVRGAHQSPPAAPGLPGARGWVLGGHSSGGLGPGRRSRPAPPSRPPTWGGQQPEAGEQGQQQWPRGRARGRALHGRAGAGGGRRADKGAGAARSWAVRGAARGAHSGRAPRRRSIIPPRGGRGGGGAKASVPAPGSPAPPPPRPRPPAPPPPRTPPRGARRPTAGGGGEHPKLLPGGARDGAHSGGRHPPLPPLHPPTLPCTLRPGGRVWVKGQLCATPQGERVPGVGGALSGRE